MQRFNRTWRGGMVAGVLLVLLAHLSPAADASAVAGITFSIGDSVSSLDEQDVRESIRFAHDYLQASVEFEPSHPLIVNVRNTSHPTDPGVVAFAGGDFLVVFTGSQGWLSEAPFDRLHVIVHEYVHIYQHDLIGLTDGQSPAWLIEGTAEYLSYQAVIERGLVRARSVRDYQAWALADAAERPDLAAVESLAAFQRVEGPVYPLSYLAIEFLLEDGTTADLDRYFRNVAGGDDWRSAFADVFGRDVDSFYEEFAEWQDELIAPTSMPKVFRSVEASDDPARVTLDEVDETVAVGEQTALVAQTDPETRCRLRLRSGNRPAVVSRQAVADTTGMVFWLVTIPDDLPPGPATVTVSCGGPRKTATIDVAEAT